MGEVLVDLANMVSEIDKRNQLIYRADKIISDLLFAVSEMSTDDGHSAFNTKEYWAAQQYLRDTRPVQGQSECL